MKCKWCKREYDESELREINGEPMCHECYMKVPDDFDEIDTIIGA